MSCLIRKECIDRVGGLKAFGHYIAEDYYIAYEVTKQGWKLRVAPTPALQNSGDYSISTWTERMIRWCKLRMRLSPLAYIEPLQECLSSAILAGIVTNYLFEWNALVVAACHILIWFIFDYLMLRITQVCSENKFLKKVKNFFLFRVVHFLFQNLNLLLHGLFENFHPFTSILKPLLAHQRLNGEEKNIV